MSISADDGVIRLFWANGIANFGDALSYDVVSWLAASEVQWAPLSSCNMIAIGSIYPWLKRSFRRRFHDVHVWGSGMLRFGARLAADSRIHVHAARGPLSGMVMCRDLAVLGDPGLLSDRVYGVTASARNGKPGLVLHYTQFQFLSDEEKRSLSGQFELIDVRNDRPMEVVEQISQCPAIYSSSLHGLIVADSLSIPNALVEPPGYSGPSTPSMFKYYDYGLSVGRGLFEVPIPFSSLTKLEAPPPPPSYVDRIEMLKDALIDVFPFRRKR